MIGRINRKAHKAGAKIAKRKSCISSLCVLCEKSLRPLRLRMSISLFLTIIFFKLAAQNPKVVFKDVTKK
ncbi:MAG: hypothetical protein NTW82_02835, partial [Bacteroidia bacterium]|nr:hypothetical protein [Bacteroidia bacterium]